MQEYRLNDTELRLSNDFAWAKTAAEVQQHVGKLVAVRNKRVIAVGTNDETLLKEAAEREGCPKEDLLLVVVPQLGLEEIPR
jgi:deoxycytidylate deaminase